MLRAACRARYEAQAASTEGYGLPPQVGLAEYTLPNPIFEDQYDAPNTISVGEYDALPDRSINLASHEDDKFGGFMDA